MTGTKAKLAYYRLMDWGNDDLEVYAPQPWAKAAEGAIICKDCSKLLVSIKDVAVPLEQEIGLLTVSKVTRTYIPFASHELFEAIGWDLVNQWLTLGTMIGPDGQRVEGFSTYQGKRIAYVRGENPFPSNHCPTCGAVRHYPTSSKQYLILEEIDPSVPIYVDGIDTLVISEAIFQRIKDRKFPNFKMRRLPLIPRAKAPANQVSFDLTKHLGPRTG